MLYIMARTADTNSFVAKGNITVEVRPCEEGEVLSFNSSGVELCTACGPNTYSFNPRNTTCDSCPDHGNCSTGGAVIVPRDGYWHSHPRSPIMHRCPLLESCTREQQGSEPTRAENLALSQLSWMAMSYNNSNGGVSESQEAEYMSLLCGDGYEGPLCGSCKQGWSRSRHACTECYSLAVSWVLFVLARVVEFFWIGGLVYLRFRRHIKGILEPTGPLLESKDGPAQKDMRVQAAVAQEMEAQAAVAREMEAQAAVAQEMEAQAAVEVNRSLLPHSPAIKSVAHQTQLVLSGSSPPPSSTLVIIDDQPTGCSDGSTAQPKHSTAAALPNALPVPKSSPTGSNPDPTSFWQLPALAVVKLLFVRPAPGQVGLDGIAEVGRRGRWQEEQSTSAAWI